jgi:hypothetical protein
MPFRFDCDVLLHCGKAQHIQSELNRSRSDAVRSGPLGESESHRTGSVCVKVGDHLSITGRNQIRPDTTADDAQQ